MIALGTLARFSLVRLLRQSDTSTEAGRAAERHRRIILTAGASLLAKIISVLSMIVTVPITLNYLGVERYGMWMTISSFAVMLTFADLGIGNGVLGAVARSNGVDDVVGMRRTIST